MDLEMLHEVVPMLKQQLEKSMLDRNYVQLERDTIQTFYDITRQEVKDLEMAVMAKDRGMELMEDNHRVEVRVYVQKVKHLEYEHANNLNHIQSDSTNLKKEESDSHRQRELNLKRAKRELKAELAEREALNAEEIMAVKEAQNKNLIKMREGFETNLQDLRDRCQARLGQLEKDLELRRKVRVVDTHEIEERKNLHVNDLMRNHKKAFGQMKVSADREHAYYNDITNDNLKLIRSLKDELTEMKKKAVANQKLMQDISQENKRLSEPLAVAVSEVTVLRGQLKDQEKDRVSLGNARARLRVMQEQLQELIEKHEAKQEEYSSVEAERDELYSTFEGAVDKVQQRSDFKNMILERKMNTVEEGIEKTSAQLSEVVKAAQLDPAEVDRMMDGLDEVLGAQNEEIRRLQWALVKGPKAYNDALRTYTQKLLDMGIPQAEITGMGYQEMPSVTPHGPAGLVAK
ncbi:unnamed protein product [Chrysoparadoxa australica]